MRTLSSIYLVTLFVLSLVALVVTHASTYQSSEFFQGWFIWVLYLDIGLIVLMTATVVYIAARLIRSWRRGEKGARLSLRLTLLFWTMSLLPTLALYGVSTAGVFRGIESWFETPLDRAFEKGIEFGQNVLGGEFARLEFVARDIANGVDGRGSTLPFWVDDLRLLHRLDGVYLYDNNGILLFSSGRANENERLSPTVLRQIENDGLSLNLKEDGKERHIEAIMPLLGSRVAHALKVSRHLPADITQGLDEIELGRNQYKKLLVLRKGLRLSFTLTLTLSLALILLFVSWLSLRLGRRLTNPLVQLSTAAAAIGGGDFSGRLRSDHDIKEIADINNSFNSMVGDLQQSRNEVQRRQENLREANAYLENLLASLTAGVLTFTAAGGLSHSNASADKLFQVELKKLVGSDKSALAELPLLSEVVALMRRREQSSDDSVEGRVRGFDGETLLIRVVSLPAVAGGGTLVMADDITRQIRAEREATWVEASRRFVHEIKNPLTPVQLAAERLGIKLKDKLDKEHAEMLERLVNTIVNQVGAMRQMVDSFRDYADNRRFTAKQTNFNTLLREVLGLYAERRIQFDTKLEDDLPPIGGDPLSLRQVLHNLLGNAVHAVTAVAAPRIKISTRRYGGWLRFSMEDNGGGADSDTLNKICEPYVTTKPQGTGLGLAVVKKTIDEHKGKLLIENGDDGLSIIILLPFYPETNNTPH